MMRVYVPQDEWVEKIWPVVDNMHVIRPDYMKREFKFWDYSNLHRFLEVMWVLGLI